MLIPAAMVALHEPHTPLQEPPGEDAVGRVAAPAWGASDLIHSRIIATALSSTMLVASWGICPGPRRVIRS